MNFHSNVALDARPRVGVFTSLCFLALPQGPISLPKLTHICPTMITHVCCCPHWVSLSLLRALCAMDMLSLPLTWAACDLCAMDMLSLPLTRAACALKQTNGGLCVTSG